MSSKKAFYMICGESIAVILIEFRMDFLLFLFSSLFYLKSTEENYFTLNERISLKLIEFILSFNKFCTPIHTIFQR